MAKNNNVTDFLTSEANKFRSVLGTSGTINPQDFDGLIDDVYTKGYNDHFLKIDSGTFELDADSATYTITGIADKNGDSFTPNVVVFIMSDDEATTHNLASHKVVAFMRRKSEISARIATYEMKINNVTTYKDIIRTNPSISGITWGNGTVKYTTSNSVYYLAKGTYAWIALRED